ncbi:uncharacterized protein LOC107743289 isoform X3 [Sinocyclocheilus rhinocerous]|uniref:uncharacterized protein LOC107743289 isoform X3 n=1 Tax=Sinocyclocheilus rhinocerous TaxID=307959 RepID=UPI0007B971CF|nr:PREDICTED: uncharacterized protein LOC107743289 isoform X3 [Sinocyclocheilus rhinocerous]
MTWLLGICTFWLLMVIVLAQKNFNVLSTRKSFNVVPAQNFNQRTGLKTDCLGSYMRLTVDKSLAFGNQIEFDAVNGSQIEPLTPSLAAKCGFSIDSDPWGNYKVFASLLNCFAGNEDDTVFDVGVRVRVRGVKAEQDVFEVEKTCNYGQWAPREVLCARNYMEVSVNRLPEEITALRRQLKLPRAKKFDQWANTVTEAITSRYNIWRIVFFTPKQKAMVLEDALRTGYSITTTRSRLVLRSGYDMPETYVENVNGVPMKIIRVTTYFKKQWSVTMLDTVAACPTGGLSFTDEMITWNFPRFNPLMSSSETNLLEMFMGIDGKRIDSLQMAARGYVLTIVDDLIVMKMPIGGPDGYYKSHVVNNQYHITYDIEPMLELLWSDGGMDSTRYKVLFPIKTPFMPRPPHFVDLTEVDQRVFDVLLGPFLYDIELVNITFSTGVLTVAEANARGINIQEQRFQNGSKAFRLQVPFSDSFVVRTQVDLVVRVYTLGLIYGFVHIQYTPFSYTSSVDVTLQDVILPTVSGTCDEEQFHIVISFGNMGKNSNIMIGMHDMTPDRRAEYGVKENDTHMSLAVPFLASDVAFELMDVSSLRARIDVLLWEPMNKWTLCDFSLACNFPMTMTDGSYNHFYVEEDYPVVKYLRSPLFFEVALLQSTDPQIELVLENCWATLKEDRNSTPRWDLIVDGCVNLADRYETVLHAVAPNSVPYPSHVKHFEIKMFTFVQNDVVLQDQMFVHCNAMLCDDESDGICKRHCPSPMPLKTGKKVRRETTNVQSQRVQLSSRKILLSSS